MAEPSNQKLRPKARLVHTLGSELISSEQVAVIELVKNAYDADASRVIVRFGTELSRGSGFVEVWDDGHGMSRRVVDEVWADIATPFRLLAAASEKGRRVLGEKGIGRLAASRLGSVTTLTTRRSDASEVVLTIDWDEFQSDVYLDEVEYSVVESSPRTFVQRGESEKIFGETVEHGTVVRTDRLRKTWERGDFEKLSLALSRLLPPRPDPELGAQPAEKFTISLQVPALSGVRSGDVGPNDVTSRPHYQVLGSVSGDGLATVVFRDNISAEERRIEFPVVIREDTGSRAPRSGPLKLDLRVWDLDRDGYEFSRRQTAGVAIGTLQQFRREIRDRSGVGLYRDGFRVQPFGDSTFDWLNLDSRRVNNPSLRVSNNQVSGFVFITADGNPELRDRSHREGLIETAAFDDLKATVVAVLSELETRRKQKRERPDRERSLGTGIFGRFDVTRLRALAEARPEDRELVAAITEVTQQIESGVTEVKQTIARFSKLATLGSLIDIVLHEGRTPLSRIRSGIAGILGRVPAAKSLSADERVAKYGSRVEAGAQLLSSLFDRIEPLSGRRRATAEVVDTDVLLDQTLELLAPRLASYKVSVERVGASTALLAQPGEVVQVLLNLIDNAIYWLAQVDKDKRRIRITSSPTPDGWLVYISDSGPGVSSSFSQEIFDAYFSTKPDGVGLGLAIAGSTIQDFYNGELELVAPDQLGGANFRLLFRSRIG